MNHLRLSTFHTAASERAEHWADINRHHFGGLTVDAMETGLLEAELSRFEMGGLHVFQISAPAHLVTRNPRHTPDALDDCYKLVLQLQGHARIEQRHRVFNLQPGDWSLYDPRVPYSISNFARTRLLVIQIPRGLLHHAKVPELHTCEARNSAELGVSAVLGSFLRSLSEQLVSLADEAAPALSDTVLSLLGHTLLNEQRQGRSHANLPETMKLRVRQYVQTHLNEETLSIDGIADAMRCSKRYLHRVFEDEPITLERYIWQARLERCRFLLSAAGQPGRDIADIAFACGRQPAAMRSRA
jgi:AraC-like DNA-binding protein